MTEQSFPFGGTAVAEPPAPELPTSYDDEPDNGNRQKLMAVGAGVVILVVLVAAFMMLKGGGSSATSTFRPVHHTPVVASTGTAPTKSTKPVHLPKSYKGHVGRDPFSPLYKAPDAAAAAPSGAAAAGPTVTVAGTPTVGTTTGAVGAPVTAPVQSAPAGPPAGYHPFAIELVSTHGTSTATLIVDYRKGQHEKTVTYADVPAPTTAARTVFGNVFALLSIQDHMATVQFGDAEPFDLARGPGNRQLVG